MAKRLPDLITYAEAIEFVDNADLSKHELSGVPYQRQMRATVETAK
jgi:hypothetical protein